MYACVCVCVCAWRHQDSGVEARGRNSNFRVNFMRKWGICSWWVEVYAYRAHFRASDAASLQQLAPLLSPVCIHFHQNPANYTLCWTLPVNTTLSPSGVSWARSWTIPPSRPPVTTVYQAVYPARPDVHFYSQGAQQPLTPGLSGVGLASPPNWQDPGSSLGPALGPLWARGSEGEVCVIVLPPCGIRCGAHVPLLHQ